MKVRCIDDISTENITKGKIYEVEEESAVSYYITDNKGQRSIPFLKWRFEVVREEQNKEVEYYEVIKEVPLKPHLPIGWHLEKIEPFVNNFNEAHKWPEFFKPIYKEEPITIGGYKMKLIKNDEYRNETFDEAQFGDQKFDEYDIEFIKRLLSPCINAEIVIKGERITLGKINKILSKLK